MTTAVRQIKPEKKDALQKIKSKIEQGTISIFADYRGLTVGQVTKLRVAIRKKNGEMYVCKNTLARRALQELNIACPDALLSGPSALINTTADPVQMTKVLVDAAKDMEKLTIKGGIFQNESVDESKIKQLAKLPSREVLIAQVIGQIKAPLTALVMTISGPIRGLVYVLKAIEEKKQEVKND